MNRKIKAAALTSILVLTPAAAVATNNDTPVGIDVVNAQCDSFTFVPTFSGDADLNATWTVEALYLDTVNEDVYKRSNKSSGTVKFGDTVGPINIDKADQYLLWAYDIRTSVDGNKYVLYGELPINCVTIPEPEVPEPEAPEVPEVPEPEEGDNETPPTEPDNTGTPSEEDNGGTPEVPGDEIKPVETPELPGNDQGTGSPIEPNRESEPTGHTEEAPVPVVKQPSFTG